MKELLIIGSGGVGRETVAIIEEINKRNKIYEILGFIDENKKLHNKVINGYRVLGGIEYISDINNKCYVVVSIADCKAKKNIVEKLNSKDIYYETIIHPNVNIHKTVRIGEGTIIYEGTIISPNVIIGKNVLISPKVGIGHDSNIMDYCTILWNVNISGGDVLKKCCFVGSGATIIQNKVLSANSRVGAGAVVINNIEEGKTVIGVPARVIK